MFSGSVKIDMQAIEDTKYVVIHSNKLQVDRAKISIKNSSTDRPVAIKVTFFPRDTQFMVIELRRGLKKGHTYVLHVPHFKGRLSDDLAGLYRSTYKDQNGNVK